ncbi:MAG: hypothetical protein EZS28_030669 [Streblomastix strix]|uniref:TATA box-binding protein-associated factor RNA polymerase I subunit B n=1 Tax=Streblomastix strix TaxID=222440 RepID=A0A5J4UU70_9EUKA|nr:MAG: hypothetical protein EZS28_030669 [Streblomastix strix]
METSNICDVCQGRSFVLSSEGYYICHICGARSSYSSGTVTIGYQDAVGPVTRIKQASVSNISQLRNQQLSSDQIDEKIKRAKQQYFLVPQDYIVAFQGLLQSQILFLVSQEVGIQPQIALVIGDIWTRYLSLLRVGALKGVQPELSISIILIALLIIRSPYTINDLIFWITKVPSEKRMPYFDFWKRLPVGSFGSKRRFHPQNPPTVSLIVSRTRNLLRVLQPLEIPPPNSLALYLRLIKYLGLPNPVNQLGIHLLQIPLQLLKRKIRKDNEKSIECNKDFFLNPLPYITAIICTTLRISYTVDCLYSNDVQRRIDDIPSWSEMVEQLLSLRSSYFAGEFIRTPHFINQIHPTATSSTSSRAFKMISPIIRTSASEDLHGLCFGGRSCEPIQEPQIDRVKEDYRKTALVRRVLQLLANYPELKIHPDFANILNKQYPTLQLDMNQTFQSLPQQLFGDNLDPSLFIFGIPPLRVYGALRQRRRRRLEKQIYDNDTDDSIGQESDINNEDQTDQEDYGDIDTQSINQENRNDTTLQHHLFNIFVPGEDQRPFPPPLSLLIDCICTRIFGISVNSFEILNLMKVIELHCFSAMPRVQEHSRGNCDSDIAHVSFTPNFPSEQQFLQQAETRMHRALHGSIMQYPNEFMDSLNIGWKRNNEQT